MFSVERKGKYGVSSLVSCLNQGFETKEKYPVAIGCDQLNRTLKTLPSVGFSGPSFPINSTHSSCRRLDLISGKIHLRVKCLDYLPPR